MTTALHFSGGKDSLACLYLHKEQWNTLLVCWVNTGAAYPDVVESMSRWKERLPHFIEIKSDQPGQIAKHGYPSDVIPMRFTSMGRAMYREPGFILQSSIQCCSQNLWQPMHKNMQKLGVTRIIRGQRLGDKRSSPIRSGHVEGGIKYIFPVEDWSRQQVMEYLLDVGADIPAYYDSELTSRDCWNCTAYLDENVERIRNMPADMRSVVMGRLKEIRSAINTEIEPLYSLSDA
jgi:phosphoadenosine phosphosulfate reductase